ncbi:MAG: ABC transporter ATP-binding protein [Chloroflexi bacterium]|nr:ABC transporter ATP-binding protein [Chloroflexota bacterium]
MGANKRENVAAMVIELRGVTKHYGDGGHAKVRQPLTQAPTTVEAVNDLSLALPRSQFLAVLGPSGCGKTTTLRLIAGLEAPDSGEIWLNGRRVAGTGDWLPPEARRVGMVFQDYALFPHLTVGDNVAFAISHWPAQQRARRVEEMLRLTGLAGKRSQYPHQLSGGEQQRVALARALAPDPAVVLLDEPFSNLDAALRKSMRGEVRQILEQASATTVFVTHDQEEALSIADVVAVMGHGTLLQIGSPHDIYLRPASREVAEFVGEANFLPGAARGDLVSCALGTLPLASPAHGPVEVMIRPEVLLLQPARPPTPTALAQVERVTFFGHDQLVRLCLGNGSALHVRTGPRPDLKPGVMVDVAVHGLVMAYPL